MSSSFIFFILASSAFADDIKDIKPPVYFQTDYLILIVFGLIVLLISLLLWIVFVIKKRKKKQKNLILPPRPADQIAYEALEALRAKGLPALGEIKQYYFELSDIIRRYIENRFNIKAPEMTTEEFLSSLRNTTDLLAAHKNLLKEFLCLCDIVKFAKYGPTQKEINDSFSAAKKLIDETKVIE
ncbi:MAG: hypothetical protein ISS44_03915 [Candidatus Omnitrophica bacterium]|nr:hypothetical protein [Candidatus Omnitrophota bacterium]